MRLADERGAVTGGMKVIAEGRFAFGQFGTQRVGAVLRRIFAGDHAAARGRTGGVGAIGAGEGGALSRQLIERRRLNLRIVLAEGVPMLLVGCNEKDVQFWHGFSSSAGGQ